jgi:hypothetical protein
MLAALVIASLAVAAAAQAQERPLATCFWEGPISTEQKSTRGFDGRTFNFPEESATYWLARFRLPDGAKLVVRGAYPHGRYMSLNAYSDGAPTDSLSDIAIEPDAGSTNPFVAGARRDLDQRAWQVTVLDEPVPERRAANTIYAQPAAGEAIELAYRVYEPDRGHDLTGGTGLPEAAVVRADGTTLRGTAACEAINDANRDITVQTVPAATWQAATSCREGHPAFDPVRWERFFNLDYSTASVPADCTDAGFTARRQAPAPVRGGLYSNKDSAYVYAHLSQVFGPVLVVEGTMPAYPATRDGETVMGDGQLRFWSLCTGESRVTTRTPDCLADRQVPIDAERRYVIAVSRAENRPSNARPECGYGWLDWGERGDGAGRSDYGLLIMRNMLVSPDFAQAIQRVPMPGAEAATMGPYFPRSGYITREAFEARGCPQPPAATSKPKTCKRTLRVKAPRGARISIFSGRKRVARARARGQRTRIAIPRATRKRLRVVVRTKDGETRRLRRRAPACR